MTEVSTSPPLSSPAPSAAALVAELERRLTDGGDPAATLAGLAQAESLELAFELLLGLLVRRGPGGDGELAPHDLLTAAQEAAARGLLPLATPTTLRRTLATLEADLHAAGAWQPRRPLWWRPLPEPTPGVELWESLGRRDQPAVTLPRAEELAAAFTAPGHLRRWLALPSFLAPSLTARLHRELEAAHGEGALGLERAGVGAQGRLGAARSDSVTFVTGREPELLASAPAAAALVQWCLRHLGRHLSAAVPDRSASLPQTAMLARYPGPSGGYRPHMDNPGGEADNGRALALVVYLNAPGRECAGGELALWEAGGSTADPPAAVLAPRSGSAALFDARAIPHQVLPVEEGPARWTLVLWLNDRGQPAALGPPLSAQIPRPTLTEVLLPVPEPPLPAGTLLFHELDRSAPRGEITVRRQGDGRCRAGVVATIYRGGRDLDAWCRHHLEVGFHHLLLIFDHLDEAEEAADAQRLREAFPEAHLTIWDGSRVAAERWPGAADDCDTALLLRLAGAGGAAYAVAARQTLNATAALTAAREGELGGEPLHWLLHLDGDELFYPQGAGRGGASAPEHFAAAQGASAQLLRYVNHELLRPGRGGRGPIFKLNPRLAAARLGAAGWAQMERHLGLEQDGPRPYFRAYHNGKSAVAVAAAQAAAGVHGWRLRPETDDEATRRFLAGPAVLHFHFASAGAFKRKYQAMAAAPDSSHEPGAGNERPFPPSAAETAAVSLIRTLKAQGADDATIDRELEELHHRLTTFSEEEVELLDAAGLLLRPRVGGVPDGDAP